MQRIELQSVEQVLVVACPPSKAEIEVLKSVGVREYVSLHTSTKVQDGLRP